MIPRLLISLLLTCILAISHAQFSDDFSDGNFTSDPVWNGDTDQFIVNAALELQLDAPVAGTAQLFSPVDFPAATRWELYGLLDFAPSSSNRLRIYLQADQNDLSASNGYFVEIGEQGSEDAIRFFRQDAGNPQFLGGGSSATVASEPAVFRLRIDRSEDGQWTLAANFTGGTDFQTDLELTDDTYPAVDGFFGVQCFFTDSRKDKFFFDDFRIAPLVPDTEGPELTEVVVVAFDTLQLTFNEALDDPAQIDPGQFQIDPTIGAPKEIRTVPGNARQLVLVLNESLQDQVTYNLQANNISDPLGNIRPLSEIMFTYIEVVTAQPFDLLINEIMADPSPVVALPDAEWIELYNNSSRSIQLEGFILEDDRGQFMLPEYVINSGEYLILFEAGSGDFSVYGNALGLADFPALTNSGDQLSLISPEGVRIHYVAYTDEWYRDSDKDDGGWTLELINPENTCQAMINWRASNDAKGGSPGQVNSVFEATPDIEGPQLVSAFALGPNQLRLIFDESVDPAVAVDAGWYVIEGVNIAAALAEAPDYTSVLLTLVDALQTDQVYEVRVAAGLTDCRGNSGLEDGSASFALPQAVASGDLLINEILFNPSSGGSRFLELVNVSQKAVQLNSLIIADRDEEGLLTDVEPVDVDYVLLPGEYVVLTPSPTDISSRYFVENPQSLVQSDLPTYNDRNGTVVVYAVVGGQPLIVDEFAYSRDLHNPLLADQNGVSLERISLERATSAAGNWYSGAESTGFATPTYENAQTRSNNPGAASILEVPDRVFSPDSDGFKDFLSINFRTPSSGYVANLRIYDVEGRLVKKLAENQLLGAQDSFIWSGETTDGDRALIGIYIVWAELFEPGGDVRYEKLEVVLGTQF